MSGSSTTPYTDLSPDRILDAIEQLGLLTDGRLLALNSYENRVYRIGLEGEAPIVAKFYRPHRWSDEQILEEHRFTAELAAHEIPAVPPLELHGRTLHHHAGFRLALTPMRGGRAPELDDLAVLTWLGRYIGRIHAIGAMRPFQVRPTLDIHTFGEASRDLLLDGDWLPIDLKSRFRQVVDQALDGVRAAFNETGRVASIRLHGDCHQGNILWTAAGPHFVDFDDARQGPAVQDLWMLLSGDRLAMSRQLSQVLAGYETFHPFNDRELHLVEALRTLRLIRHAAWLAQRWQDPAFPIAFPWFGTHHYWQGEIHQLEEQIETMARGPLPRW